MILFTMDEEDSLPASPEIVTGGSWEPAYLPAVFLVPDFWITGAWRGPRS
jgi:hypothetical protein